MTWVTEHGMDESVRCGIHTASHVGHELCASPMQEDQVADHDSLKVFKKQKQTKICPPTADLYQCIAKTTAIL